MYIDDLFWVFVRGEISLCLVERNSNKMDTTRGYIDASPSPSFSLSISLFTHLNGSTEKNQVCKAKEEKK